MRFGQACSRSNEHRRGKEQTPNMHIHNINELFFFIFRIIRCFDITVNRYLIGLLAMTQFV